MNRPAALARLLRAFRQLRRRQSQSEKRKIPSKSRPKRLATESASSAGSRPAPGRWVLGERTIVRMDKASGWIRREHARGWFPRETS
jgi:hypothetical protein